MGAHGTGETAGRPNWAQAGYDLPKSLTGIVPQHVAIIPEYYSPFDPRPFFQGCGLYMLNISAETLLHGGSFRDDE
jgi:hypothetical protein